MSLPQWVNEQEYPFEPRTLTLPEGNMHYVDEGEGEVLLMVHGTPMWSYLYRHLIRGLRAGYRVVALDHLGFGLSAKPDDYSYLPEVQAATIAAFIEKLDLRNITLMVHDFGGPLGLSYAISHPVNVRRLVLFNTWMWSLRDDRQTAFASRFLGSPIGRALCVGLNFEVNVITPYAYGDRSKLTRDIHAQYRAPQQDRTARYAVWVYARELLASGPWYDALWAQRDAIRDIPALLMWGLRDPLFGEAYLQRWQALFRDAHTITYPQTGHYVQEEQGAALVPPIETFLHQTP